MRKSSGTRPADNIESVQRREAALTLSPQLEKPQSQTHTDPPLDVTTAAPDTAIAAVTTPALTPATTPAVRPRRRKRREEEDNEWTGDYMPSDQETLTDTESRRARTDSKEPPRPAEDDGVIYSVVPDCMHAYVLCDVF